LSRWNDGQIAAATGTDRGEDFAAAEAETVEAIVWIGTGEPPSAQQVIDRLADALWSGRANPLSQAHREWPDIPLVAAATARALGADPGADPDADPGADMHGGPAQPAAQLPALVAVSLEPVSRLIRRRRSAQAFDGITALDATAFFRMLDALLPRPGVPPWSLLERRPQVHPVIFVHRVDGIEPGLYCLPRDPAAAGELRAAMRPDWLWTTVSGCPSHLPLRLLAPLDVREFAATVSCHQDIAADSAFSLAMLARFDDITAARPWRYRHRFWEAGILGHALYLEAEAAGMQGTGIGCYFDDAVHQALGLDTERFQDIYHFTVGRALVDARLASEPAYAHRAGRGATDAAA
jgi:hypothetical protein